MAKPRVTATDQLSNVIEVVELGQRTGLLSVERGSGSVLEEGEIYFVSGRAVYAALAGLRGREALVALSRWGACRFAFDREAARPAPNLTNPQQQAVRPPASQPSPLPNPASSWPHYAQSQPGHVPPTAQPRPQENSPSWPATSGGAGAGAGSYSRPIYPTNAPFASPVQPGPPTGTLRGGSAGLGGSQRMPFTGEIPNSGQLGGAAGGSHAGGGAAVNSAVMARRPRRAPDVRDLMVVVNTHNLSRSHRTVLLLADGEHTVLDLARLSSKAPDEVVGLLDELESRGLVYYYE